MSETWTIEIKKNSRIIDVEIIFLESLQSIHGKTLTQSRQLGRTEYESELTNILE
jgi:hypothetical protein